MIDNQSDAGAWKQHIEDTKFMGKRINLSRKGKEFEQEFCKLCRSYGLEADRTPRSGATRFAKGDVRVQPGFGGEQLEGECKRRADIPKWIIEALGDHDFMSMRGDRGEALVVIRADFFAELLQ